MRQVELRVRRARKLTDALLWVEPWTWSAEINSYHFSPVTILSDDVEVYSMQLISKGSDSPA
jgi:hypothetical protein